MKTRVLLKAFFVALFLTSCVTQATAIDTARPFHASQEAPDLTATERPKLTPQLIASATATTMALTSTPTVTPTPNFSASQTAVIQAIVATVQPTTFATYPSPDRQWRVEVVIYDCVRVEPGPDATAYEQLRVIQTDGRIRVVADQVLACGGLGFYGFGGLAWSPNSRYFYFTDERSGAPDGGDCHWRRSVSRVDVATGLIEAVPAGPFSPDKTALAAIKASNEIALWSLDRGEIAIIPPMIPTATLGAIAWSPDGQALVYVQTQFECYPFGTSYLVRLDLGNLQATLLLESKTPSFRYLEWGAPDRITLFDEGWQRWEFDLATRKLNQVP
ncbi:MAG: hypothetical protein RMK99_03085 [Anaerolineales bacterium]|nr:hypothetical protein [Anaerolineales bacterium]